MKVCDKHPEKRAVVTIVFQNTDERFDLCAPCEEEIRKFISQDKPESVKSGS